MNNLDIALYNILVSLQNPAVNWLWVFLSRFGIYAVFGIAGYIFFKRKDARDTVALALQTIFTLVISRGFLTESIYFFFNRQRPFETLSPALFSHAGGESFPSGHTVAMFSVALILYGWDKKLGKYALGIAVLSGFARAVSGVHWMSDILGGIAIAYIGYRISKRMAFNKKPISSETQKQAV